MRSVFFPATPVLVGWLLVARFSIVAAQPSRACWLVTPAEAAQILGRPDLVTGELIHDDYATCNYLGAGFDVHMNHARPASRTREILDDAIKSGKVEAVTGLGDRAGFDKSGKQNSLVVIKGPYVIETRVLSSWQGPAEQIKPTMVKLAQTALSKIGAGKGTFKTSRACWLITPVEAAEILGKPELKSGDAIHDDYDDCDYKAAGFDLDMLSYTRASPRVEGFKTLVARGNAEAVAGLGDAAILGHDASNRPTINILKGRREYMITWLDATKGAADAKPQLVQLAKAAFAKIP